MWKIYRGKYSMFTEKRYVSLNSNYKHSEIWNKLIRLQRKRYAEQRTNKDKKLKSIQEFRLLLKQSGNLLCTFSTCKT